jgi:hypothetical protein
MSLIDPSKMSLASVECTLCGVSITSPTNLESLTFQGEHTHGHPILEAWFESRLDAYKETQRGLTTCSNPEVEHPGFTCNHPPFDPNA